jgi:hypothetical protein
MTDTQPLVSREGDQQILLASPRTSASSVDSRSFRVAAYPPVVRNHALKLASDKVN